MWLNHKSTNRYQKPSANDCNHNNSKNNEKPAALVYRVDAKSLNFVRLNGYSMMRWLLSVSFLLACTCGFAQGFELASLLDLHKGTIGEIVKAPVRFKNTTDKPITLILRKVSSQIGSTQKNFFCIDNNCLDARVEDYIVRVDAGQTLANFYVALEAGLMPGTSSVRYIAYNKSLPSQPIEFDINFAVDEKPEKQRLYTSRAISVHEIYPNPVVDQAYVDYRILDDRVKAKVRLHNILGTILGEYELPASETMMIIKTYELNAGIYFYTLYLDNEGVMTRKLVVKK